ncbi:MAG: internal scaffolding protein [Microvirus sp.]|nr:MAG: internal scaffolding protein [Microvirus sp.]
MLPLSPSQKNMKNSKKSDLDLDLAPDLPGTPNTRQQLKTNAHYRSAYGPRLRQTISFPEQGKAKQEFKNECDINNIMARFDKTGMLSFTNRFQPQYGDTTGIEFQSAMETIAQGRSMFQELPSGIRNRFKNDPAQFLDFVHDERNIEELRAMGLLRPSDAQATPLPDPSPKPSQGPRTGLAGDSKSGVRGSELDRGAEGPAKSGPTGHEKTA